MLVFIAHNLSGYYNFVCKLKYHFVAGTIKFADYMSCCAPDQGGECTKCMGIDCAPAKGVYSKPYLSQGPPRQIIFIASDMC